MGFHHVLSSFTITPGQETHCCPDAARLVQAVDFGRFPPHVPPEVAVLGAGSAGFSGLYAGTPHVEGANSESALPLSCKAGVPTSWSWCGQDTAEKIGGSNCRTEESTKFDVFFSDVFRDKVPDPDPRAVN